ncbi:sulfotransferase domain-containing protein [Candidatus Pelagibacter sp.]|jgi:hypothetical protein|nr:sulfotransferase domain-containing protein [Candidatus Pelagibacter sp.]
MIIWLASYPKSGNTWVRSIISSLLYTEDGIFNFKLLKKIDQFPKKAYFKEFINNFNNFNEIKKNWIVVQDKINLDNKVKLFKTHQGKYTVENDNFTNEDNSCGVIYVVRDPRNVVKSISNHYTLSIEQSLKFMLSVKIIGNGKDIKEDHLGIYTLLGTWNDHYRSWTRNKKNLLVIRYEDLISNTQIEIEKIIFFLKKYTDFKTSDSKIKNILKTTSFESLKKMESEDLFIEGVLNKETKSKVKFFNLGPKNKWKGEVNDNIIDSIEKNFEKEMLELNYLN